MIRKITNPIQAHALAPGAIMLAPPVDDGDIGQAWQKGRDGAWRPCGAAMAVEADRMFGDRDHSYSFELVFEPVDTRPGYQKAADLAPLLTGFLKQHCADTHPGVKVTIRKTVTKAHEFADHDDTHVNVSYEFPAPPTAQDRTDFHMDLQAVAQRLGFPISYLKIRQKQLPLAERPVTMQEIQPHLKRMGIRTSHSRKYPGFRIKTNGDGVSLSVDFDNVGEGIRTAEAVQEEFEQLGYAVDRTDSRLHIRRAAAQPDAVDLDAPSPDPNTR